MSSKTVPIITPVIGPISGPGVVSARISFVITAKDLPMRDRGFLGTTVQDPYIKWFHRTSKLEMEECGSTKHRVNEPNPVYYDTVFSYDWMKGTGQQWRFDVLDFDPLNKDDAVGSLTINVDDYVLKHNEKMYSKLDNAAQGSLILRKVETVKFTLSAKDIPKLDPLSGLSDPYVECFWSFLKDGHQTLFHKTKVIKNVEECKWEDPIEFPIYQKGESQFWTFKVFDKDPLPKDDKVGVAVVSVDEFEKTKNIIIHDLAFKDEHKAKLIVSPVAI